MHPPDPHGAPAAARLPFDVCHVGIVLRTVVLVLVSVGTVWYFLPMAWDRYYLPFQAPAALAGAVCLARATTRLARARGSPGVAA